MLDTLISSKNTFTYDTSKEIQEMLVKEQVAKTAQDIFMGIRLVDSVAKEHMMAYDKQTIKRLYNDVRQGNNL